VEKTWLDPIASAYVVTNRIRSETFYAAYISGEEPEDESWMLDFGEWASVYRTWLARQAAYRNSVLEDYLAERASRSSGSKFEQETAKVVDVEPLPQDVL
jgi:hypothetical protein